MKFLVDAQLPRSLARRLQSLGHDSLHTLDLPLKNRTSDDFLGQKALEGERILITKDGDFVDSFLLRGRPPKLLLVTTGNIPNNALLELFQNRITSIVTELSMHSFLEIDLEGLTIRA